MLKKKEGRRTMNTIKKLDGKYLFTRFCSNTEVAVSELERGKLNTVQNIHYSIIVGLPYTVNEANTLLNSKDWTPK